MTFGEELYIQEAPMAKSANVQFLNFSARAWSHSTKDHFHDEWGFLTVDPTGNATLMTAGNNGFTTYEVGRVVHNKLVLTLKDIGRISFSRDLPVEDLRRTFIRHDDRYMEQVIEMRTATHPKTGYLEHTRIAMVIHPTILALLGLSIGFSMVAVSGNSFICIVDYNTYRLDAALAAMSIDIGSQFIKIGLVKPGVPMEIVLNKESRRKTPNIISIRNKERLFAEAAAALVSASKYPTSAYQYILLLLAKQIGDPSIELYKQRFPFASISFDQERKTVVFPNELETYNVETLLAMILWSAKQTAEAFAGQSVKDVVITVPIFFNQAERRALTVAADIAGLNLLQASSHSFVLLLLNDGSAAALNYGVFRRKEITEIPQTMLIYDVGASKTTATIVYSCVYYYINKVLCVISLGIIVVCQLFSNALLQLGPLNISLIGIKGLTTAVQEEGKYENSEIKGVKASFSIDLSGIISIAKAEFVVERKPSLEELTAYEEAMKIYNEKEILEEGKKSEENYVDSKINGTEEVKITTEDPDNIKSEEIKEDLKKVKIDKKKDIKSKPVEPKKKTVKIDLTVSEVAKDMIDMTKDNLSAAKKILIDFEKMEKEKHDHEEAMNALEALVLSSNIFPHCTTELQLF
uniref:Hypoxia up-regulated protein 1 n=1 Tax=Heterorhabditis bacteriophora TaxID=37862 RepID=A0A1I7XNN3_HETBA